MREEQLPHLADAIQLFNDSRNQTTKATVLICWIKSKCLPAMVESEATSTELFLTETCINLLQGSNGLNAVEFEDVRELEERISAMISANP